MSADVDLLVVGAGVAGATAARVVADAGATVQVVEKSRGLGGRCATRRSDDGLRLDHGAQFFTVRDSAFRDRVERWLEAGDVAVWAHGFARWSPASGLEAASGDGHPRYVAPAGMSRLGRLLIGDVVVTRQARVAQVRRDEGGWRVTSEDGSTLRARSVVMTPPAPQTLALLEREEIAPTAWDALDSIRYGPSFALMAAFDRAAPSWTGIRFEGHPVLAWVANDGSKRYPSPETAAVVAHGTPAFARERFDDDREAVGDALERALTEVVGWQDRPVWRRVHRWRYAQTETPLDRRSLRLAPGLHAAGDGFGAGRVEGAFLSGLAAADAVLHELQHG